MTTNNFDSSRPSFVRSNLSSIRFNRVLGNIGAPLRDGSHEYEEDEDLDVVLDQADAEIMEVRRGDEEGCTGISFTEAMHGIAEESIAGPSRSSATPV